MGVKDFRSHNFQSTTLPMVMAGARHSPSVVTAQVLKGGQLKSQEEVIRESIEKYGNDPFAVPCASVFLPGKAPNQGITITGSTGCGKTVLINQIKRNRLYHVGKGYGHRIAIWDEKGEERQYLESLELSCPVYYLNPFDQDGGVGIDFASEVTGPREALRLATDLLSATGDGKGDSLSWLQAGCMIFSEVLQFFQRHAPRKWRLIDVLEVCQFENQLRPVLSDSHRGKALCSGTLGANRQAKGVMFTLQTNLQWLWSLACAMRYSQNITLKGWVEDYEAVLVLPNIDEYEPGLGPLHRYVFGRAGRLINSRPYNRGEVYTFFVDEMQRAPFPHHLVKMVTVGRSKGCALIAGAQDVQGVQEALGEKQAGVFFGCSSTQVWMQTNNPATAAFASSRFGSPRVLLTETSHSVTRSVNSNAFHGSETELRQVIHDHLDRLEMRPDPADPKRSNVEGSALWAREDSPQRKLYEQFGIVPKDCPVQLSTNVSETQGVTHKQTDQAKVIPDEFMRLPKPPVNYRIGDELTIHSFITSTFLGEWRETSRHMEQVTIFPDTTIPSYVPRPDEDLEFDGWSDEERKLLKIPDPLPEPNGTNPSDDD